jgi:glutamate dehydrogenase
MEQDQGATATLDDTEGHLPDVPDARRLTADAAALAGDDAALAALVARFWRYAPDEELMDLTPSAMLSAVTEHRELAAQRVLGELKLEIKPSDDGDSTIIEIVADDMPFLVDSVNSALAGRGLDVHLLVHPLMVVRREPLGRLVDVLTEVDPDDATAEDLVESWMHLEVDRVRDESLVSDVTWSGS